MPISKKMEKRNGGTEGIQRKGERKVRLLRRNDAFSRIFHCTTLHHEGPGWMKSMRKVKGLFKNKQGDAESLHSQSRIFCTTVLGLMLFQ